MSNAADVDGVIQRVRFELPGRRRGRAGRPARRPRPAL